MHMRGLRAHPLPGSVQHVVREQAALAIGVAALGAEEDLAVELASHGRVGPADITLARLGASSVIMVHLFLLLLHKSAKKNDYQRLYTRCL